MTYITTSNLYWDRFELSNIKQMRFTDEEIENVRRHLETYLSVKVETSDVPQYGTIRMI